MSDVYVGKPSKVLVNTMQFPEYTQYITEPITNPKAYVSEKEGNW